MSTTILNNYIEQESTEIIKEILPNISSILTYLTNESNNPEIFNKCVGSDEKLTNSLLNILKNGNQQFLINFYNALINCGNLFCFSLFLKIHLVDMLR